MPKTRTPNPRPTRSGVYVLIGPAQDPCCQSVGAALEAHGCRTLHLPDPFAHPARLAWRLSDEGSASRLNWRRRRSLADGDIAGVFVRRGGGVDPAGWEPGDLAYLQAEAYAALLAWLWSLPCPVVNRLPAALWYQPQQPLLAWHRLLRQSGLPALEMLITNEAQAARDFGRRRGPQAVDGAVYSPLTSGARYLVSQAQDWDGLAALQGRAPVCLARPHGAARLACVAGERVVWEGGAPPEAGALEPALRRFAAAAGLDFVQLALAPAGEALCVVAVEAQPQLERFGAEARQEIVEGVVERLAGRQRVL
jgi:hypothetical protein